ncbi:MAG: DUF2442 domain-containing protein [Bacteroidales bacterium]
MNPRAKEVKYISDYNLLIKFTNDEERIFNISSLLADKWFAPLSDINLYKQVYVIGGTIEWNNGIDICPDDLYNLSQPLPH